MKVLSIIVPTYNMESILEGNLRSLIVSPETMPDLEVLVVNDGSKDNSSLVAHSFQQSYPQTFRVIDKENGNYGSCINVGLKEASGQYVKVMDADDSFDTSALESFILRLKGLQEPVDLILSDFRTTDGNGHVYSETIYNFTEGEILPFSAARESLLQTNLFMAAITYRTQMVKDMGYRQTEGISYTDIEWVYIPLFKVRTFTWFNLFIYNVYSGRPGQTVSETVMTKNYSHVIVATKKNAEYYISQRNVLNNDADYLSEKLIQLLTAVYSRCLLHKDIVSSILLPLDNLFLSSDISFKKSVDGFISSKSGIHYVRLWRRMKRKDPLHLLYLIERLAGLFRK